MADLEPRGPVRAQKEAEYPTIPYSALQCLQEKGGWKMNRATEITLEIRSASWALALQMAILGLISSTL